MNNFIVSARKYRPATFHSVVGQYSVTTTLKNAIGSNHLAHAYLFCGPRGVGKTTCARIFAKTLNCFNRTSDTEACNECESCRSFNELRSFNIHELDAASNNSVEDIRNLIDQIRIPPQIGKYSIYIIDEVHMLSASAFDSFRKTLEEPPKHAIFILATTEKHKIIPTILSRCQIFDFNRIKIDDIVGHLAEISKKEKVKSDEDALHIIGQKVDGSMRDALSIFDQMVSLSGDNMTYKTVIDNLSILDFDYYFKVTDALLEKNTSSSLLIFNEILNKGFDGHHFINGLAEHFRNLLVCKDEITLQLMEVSANIRERYKKQSKKTEADFLLRGLCLLNKADVQYKASRNQRLLVELTLLQLCSLHGNVSGVEKKIEIISSPKSEALNPKSETINSKISTSYPQPTSSSPIVSEPPVQKISSSSPAKEIPAKPTNGKIPLKGNMLSISAITNGNTSLKTKSQTVSPSLTTSEAKDLETTWKDFAESIKKKNKINLSSTLTARIPVMEDDPTISFSVLNQVQEDEINFVKTDLLSFLRSEMKNPSLQVKILVDKHNTERKPYTGEEKFQHLSGKNPALNKLRQQFNLEIDF